MRFIQRPSVRAVVLTPEHSVLLMRARTHTRNAYWYTPGGGLEAGESHEQGLRRELQEELGLVDFELGPLLGQHRFTSEHAEMRVEHHQYIYLVPHACFEPHMSDPIEVHNVDALRWWPLSELLETAATIYPEGLGARVMRYLECGDRSVHSWVA